MPITVLIVDDNVQLCELFSQFLKGRGFEANFVHNGHDAIAAYTLERPDLVLMDVLMPGKDGVQTFREIKELDPKAKVIFLTVVHDEKLAEQLLSEGALDYMNKPIVPEDFKSYLLQKFYQFNEGNLRR